MLCIIRVKLSIKESMLRIIRVKLSIKESMLCIIRVKLSIKESMLRIIRVKLSIKESMLCIIRVKLSIKESMLRIIRVKLSIKESMLCIIRVKLSIKESMLRIIRVKIPIKEFMLRIIRARIAILNIMPVILKEKYLIKSVSRIFYFLTRKTHTPMSNVKLGFGKLPIPMKIQVTRNIVVQTAASGAFVTPDPPLATITTAVDALETAYENSRDGGKAKTAFMYLQEKELTGLMTKLVAYVQATSGGDETIILLAGMSVKSPKTPPQPLDAPQNLRVIMGRLAGDITPKWKNLLSCRLYMVETSIDGITWVSAGNSTKATITLSGFTSGSKVWVRAAGVNAKGQGPWSSPAQGMAA